MDRLLILLLMSGFCAAGVASDLRYPVPDGARNPRHIRLADTGGEQDYFDVARPYPSVSVLDHYRKVFAKWTECKPPEPWQSFGDVSGAQPRFIHQLIWQWVKPDNRSVMTLLIRYESEGARHRVRPDNDIQRVVLIEYAVPDGLAAAKELGGKCGGA